jgi:hypothetical protein
MAWEQSWIQFEFLIRFLGELGWSNQNFVLPSIARQNQLLSLFQVNIFISCWSQVEIARSVRALHTVFLPPTLPHSNLYLSLIDLLVDRINHAKKI